MKKKPTLSVLDIGPIRSNQSATDCFSSMVKLAQVAEDLGFCRYWLAEHHNVDAVAASHTSVLSSVIAANTKSIRVGGCVLLPHYAPLLVAEQMGIVEACFPGRVDLGVGRSSGSDWTTSALLRGSRPAENDEQHPQRLTELLSLIRPEGVSLSLGEREYELKAVPNASSSPRPWILGTSDYSASLAAEFGLPYAFGYHIRAEGAKEAIELYRQKFKPSVHLQSPRVLVSAIVVVGETASEAQRLARPQLHFMSAFRSGEPVMPQMLVEDADGIEFPEQHEGLVKMFKRSWIIGDPDEATNQVLALADDLAVDEIMLNPIGAAYASDPADQAPNREFALRSIFGRMGVPM